jgi:hypothetical protein
MSAARKASTDAAALPWAGPERRYDIVKEFVIALVVMAVLAVGLAVAFSSPDEKALTFKGWGTTAPDNFYAVAVGELAGTTESAAYGPPYQEGDGIAVGPLRPQKWMGVRIPVDAANDFVITPLKSQEQPAEVTSAIAAWEGATPDQRTAWATAYDDAVQKTADADGALHPDQAATGDYGPVPVLAKALTGMAASGALDGAMVAQGSFYGTTDNTKQILFMGDGSYLDDAATAQNLQGNTWGMMNGTNSYPGQPWLWWASFWYQIPLFNPAEDATTTTSLQDNADAWIFYIIGFIGLVIIFYPFIPGLRSIPKWIPVHRLIWRNYYRKHGNSHLV